MAELSTSAFYFVKHTPISELKYVLEDLEIFLNNSTVFTKDLKANLVHDYNIAQYIHVDLPEEKKLLLTRFNEVDRFNYLDPRTNKCYQVDHITGTAVGESGQGKGSSHDKLRAELQGLVDTYVDGYYKKKKAMGMVFINGDTLSVVISAINTNLACFWTGNIRTTYQVDLSESNWEIKAACKANSHYFEDGNVQLACTLNDCTVPVKTKDAQGICTALGAFETKWSDNLDTFYVDLHEKTMKHMRRALPITRTLFDWGGREAKLADEFGTRQESKTSAGK